MSKKKTAAAEEVAEETAAEISRVESAKSETPEEATDQNTAEVARVESGEPAQAEQAGAPLDYDPMALITPQMACSWLAGDPES